MLVSRPLPETWREAVAITARTMYDNLRDRSSIARFELGLQTVLDGIERRFLDRSG